MGSRRSRSRPGPQGRGGLRLLPRPVDEGQAAEALDRHHPGASRGATAHAPHRRDGRADEGGLGGQAHPAGVDRARRHAPGRRAGQAPERRRGRHRRAVRRPARQPTPRARAGPPPAGPARGGRAGMGGAAAARRCAGDRLEHPRRCRGRTSRRSSRRPAWRWPTASATPRCGIGSTPRSSATWSSPAAPRAGAGREADRAARRDELGELQPLLHAAQPAGPRPPRRGALRPLRAGLGRLRRRRGAATSR